MAQIFLSYYFCCVGGAVDDTSTSIHADFKQKILLKIIVVIIQTFSTSFSCALDKYMGLLAKFCLLFVYSSFLDLNWTLTSPLRTSSL